MTTNLLLERGEKLTIVIGVDHSPFYEIALAVLEKLMQEGNECGFDLTPLVNIYNTLLEDEPRPLQ